MTTRREKYQGVAPGRTFTQVLEDTRRWDKEHDPYDRATKLDLFQFIVEAGKGGALVPLSGERKVQKLPTLYFKPHALDQLIARIGYDKKVAERLPDALNLQVVNWLIQNPREGQGNDVMMRIQDQDQMRAMMSGRFEPFDNLELLNLLAPFCKDSTLRWEFNDDLTFHLSLTFPKTRTEIKKGDIAESGLHISNSEVGCRSITIAAYVYRYVCSNGAIGGNSGGDVFRFRHIGDGDRIRGAVEAAIHSIHNEALKIKDQFKEALTKRIKDPAAEIEKICNNEQMTQEKFRAVLNSYVAGKEGKTLFGVSQAFSAAAHDYQGEDSYELQKLSAKVLSLPVGRK